MAGLCPAVHLRADQETGLTWDLCLIGGPVQGERGAGDLLSGVSSSQQQVFPPVCFHDLIPEAPAAIAETGSPPPK